MPEVKRRALDIEKPLGTIVGGADKHAVASAILVDAAHSEISPGVVRRWESGTQDIETPIGTISDVGQHRAEVRAFLLSYYGTDQGPKIGGPLATVTSRDRFGLVTIHGQDYQIIDIGLRMLAPRELCRAQGFPDSYIIGETQPKA